MSAGLVDLFGSKLLSGVDEVNTSDALAGKQAVAIYFSAHWCPPCRGFTPQLAGWYSAGLKDKLEIVFASSDRDETAFKEYFGEMPWKALPYSDRQLKEKLSKKFKVNGIPSVVIVDSDGKVITTDGRSAISEDPKGEKCPWKPVPFADLKATMKLIGKDGPVDARKWDDGQVLGLYFSAHWCPPCKAFTPDLAEWYNTDLKAKGFEIVFVSSDKTQDAFNEYFKEQPWLALDYAQREEKEQLSKCFGVEGIPTFVIIDADGSVISKDGRTAVSKDPTGVNFPWHPEPVIDLADGPGPLNEAACVIALCDGADEAAAKAAEEAMTPVAKKFIAEAKAKGEEDPEIAFMIAKTGVGLVGQIRKLTKTETVGSTPQIILMNIPDDGAFYVGAEGGVTAEYVEKFVQDFKAGSLTRQQLEK